MNNAGVRVPNGFAVTAQAYRHVLDQADAWAPLHRALDGLDARDVDDLARRAQAAREIVLGATLPARPGRRDPGRLRALRARVRRRI